MSALMSIKGTAVDLLAQSDAIFQPVKEVTRRQPLSQNPLNPAADLFRSSGRILVEAQLSQILV